MKKIFLSIVIAITAMCFAPVNTTAAEMQVPNQVAEMVAPAEKEIVVIIIEHPDGSVDVIVIVSQP